MTRNTNTCAPQRTVANFRAVKALAVLIALTVPLKAALVATVETTLGDIVVELQYDKAPQAVANFITLAEGSRTRVDPTTGSVTNAPLYVGEKFFRVVNEPTFKIAQTGSGTGNNSGGPGYTFRDEFDPSLSHVPYVLSMANSGVATNGSQIFFTGNATASHLDNVHTVFGVVTDTASRGVIDAIHAAGNDGSSITRITFARTDTTAAGFDEHAQNLPVCSGGAGKLAVIPGQETRFDLTSPQAAGTVLQAFRSTDLQTWSKLGEIYQGTGQTGFSDIKFDNASAPSAFFHIPVVMYPDALAPASLANRTLTVGLMDNQTFTFQFDATGTGGTGTYSENPGSPTTITEVSYSPAPHKAVWIISTTSYNPLRFQGFLKSETSAHVLGTNTCEQWNGSSWSSLGGGSLSLTK